MLVCCQGRGYSIGGGEVTDRVMDAALAHMTPWVLLCKDTVAAEFPEFSLMMAFSAFKLPKGRGAPCHVISDTTHVQLKRLQQTYGQPTLVQEIKDHLPHARNVYADKSFAMPYWDAWSDAIATLRRVRGNSHPSAALEYVVARGRCMVNVTSGIEQSFARVCQRLPPQRLSASDLQEERIVSILLADRTDSELAKLAQGAQQVYMEVATRNARTHKRARVDAGVPKTKTQRALSTSSAHGVPTERNFLRRMSAQVKRLAPDGGSQRTVALGAWGPSHDAERAFQHAKRRKRLVEAHGEMLILPSEQTTELLAAADGAANDKIKSRKAMEKSKAELQVRIAGEGPRGDELRRAAVFCDRGVAVPLDAFVRHEARQVATPWEALVFVCDDPWWPCDDRVKVTAALLGAWVMDHQALVGNGAALKYKRAVSTRRVIWASDGFRTEHATMWQTILECLNVCQHAWKVLRTAEQYAEAKIKARHTPAAVWALLTAAEGVLNQLPHVYSAAEFTESICVVEKRTFGSASACI